MNFKKIICLLMALCLVATLAFGCTKTTESQDEEVADATEEAEDEETEEESYAEATTDYVAKVGGEPVYESDFYYFLYQGMREIYYAADGIYDEDATDEENLATMIAYFNSEAEDGETYLQKAVNRTLDIAKGFKIACILGKEAGEISEDYQVSEEEIETIMEYIESEAEYGAYYYGLSGDEYFYYMYGMKVNDAKRYSENQLYAEMHETYWADQNGYSVGMDEPTEPEEPTEPDELDDDATDEEKAQYEEDLAEYNEAVAAYDEEVAQYEEDVEKYNELLKIYWEKFRQPYEEDKATYDIRTIQYIFIEADEEDANAAEEEAQKYIKLYNDGYELDSIVKGFSDAEYATSDLGLVDIDIYDSDAEYDVPLEVLNWANEQNEVGTALKEIVTEDGIYLVIVVGITDFDNTSEILAVDSGITYETVRENVEYNYLATLYNDFVDSYKDDEKFATTELNNERMLELATEYLNYNVDDEEADEE